MEIAVHRTQDTYPLSHFRQHTSEHLQRIAEGVIEVITQNGEAAMIVMSPEKFDAMVHQIERGHLWSRTLDRIERGEEGEDARQTIYNIARELGIDL